MKPEHGGKKYFFRFSPDVFLNVWRLKGKKIVTLPISPHENKNE